jgi:hypothetical protein
MVSLPNTTARAPAKTRSPVHRFITASESGWQTFEMRKVIRHRKNRVPALTMEGGLEHCSRK